MTIDQDAPPEYDAPPAYEVAEGALQFAAPELAPGEEPPGTPTPFQIIGDSTVLYAVKPKQGVLLDLGSLVSALEDSADPEVALGAYDRFMDAVLSPEARTYLEDRFKDPAHDWDLPILQPVMKGLVAHWFRGNPTGGRPASAASPRATGKRSTGRARSRARTPSA